MDFGGNRRWNTETLKVRIGNAMQAALTVQINYDALIEVFDLDDSASRSSHTVYKPRLQYRTSTFKSREQEKEQNFQCV